ncbi:1-deoxy-D-xylulose-5-phosphate reductoisomerase [Helicobacter sp. 11S03491-1]|uniref:1-deoxy-D-xylulose-5-phosphate reductoisomerase n=1 Tax=Helicobacter sp. 11S03491-1 TaxID=1476196 RepID=UPI000BA60907|nr:1-deoxy-D-xylulose-5-phosphate reductoisomerase [Helicobacter sp. 11S03491-1]PAF41833.1 1-deoxy-D-xylulose-5-phosphate reductoisomerase [Helicobacter sp. 11S03491-1]
MILLGSTGSIGVNTLQIAQKFQIPIESLSAGRNIDLLNAQIAHFHPKKVAILDPKDRLKLQPKNAKVYTGSEGICEMIADSSSSLVVNALVGFGGLKPTFTALHYHKKLALANKESLVVAGWLLDTSKIIPIDSEHFGLWYLCNNKPIKKFVITASGGAFRDTPPKDIPSKKTDEALKHPNWKMGKKITIDSATMVNKLFEVLETKWLFGIDEIAGYIERSSHIHALIEFIDGSITAHLAYPDMKLPIAYALDPKQAAFDCVIPNINLENLAAIKFESIDAQRYPLWKLKDILIQNPQLGVILNASNEIAVTNFLECKINFGKINFIIQESINKFNGDISYLKNQEDILYLDKEVRKFTHTLV